MRAWIRALLIGKEHKAQPCPDVSELANRVHRLEIQHNELRERLDSLEGRHASLSAQFRGRMGGRPPKPQHAQLGGMTLPI